MSVNVHTYRPMLPSQNQWLVVDNGPLRHMIAKVDGAELRYAHPGSGMTVAKKFVSGSVLTHLNDTNILTYFSGHEIPFVDEVLNLAAKGAGAA